MERNPMLLEIDAGNTRIKWRVIELTGTGGGAWRASGVITEPEAQAAIAKLMASLEKAQIRDLSRIFVSSVRGDAFRTHCRSELQERFGVSAEFAVAELQCRGVCNGYAFPERLGVDRWLALVAAFEDAREACCVIDCGTTITLDVVGASGQHFGGFIVPGLKLMRDALAGRSSALVILDAQIDTEPGTTTAEAITHGTYNMALGFIRDQYWQVLKQHGQVQWYLTGGDAPVLAQQLEWEHKLVPDLVLDGLRLALL
jgi:type III pantothenate kinase